MFLKDGQESGVVVRLGGSVEEVAIHIFERSSVVQESEFLGDF